MEVFMHEFYAFDLDEMQALLSFNWMEKSTSMTATIWRQNFRNRVGAFADARQSDYRNRPSEACLD
jgi:hypothetical protein